jgi:SAM-dependent methyltransferase
MGTASGLHDEPPTAALHAWFQQEPGRIVAAAEHRLLGRILPDLFGYHIVQLGCHHTDGLIASSRISHQIKVELGHAVHPDAHLYCLDDALPVASGAIDVLVLPHILEFAHDARRVLREAERVLIGEGHIVILGFNPWSFHGMWSLLWRWRRRVPWSGHFIGATRVKDWLQLLGFDIVHFARASFRPPLRRARFNQRLEFLENLGAFCWPVLGNVYLVVGKKRVEGVTPLKVGWRQRRRLVAGGMVEPTTREMK